jgi:hypothetical protein
MGTTTKSRNPDQRADDDRLNDQFHTLLREAAEKREGRELSHASKNRSEAEDELAGLMALARSGEAGRGNGTARHGGGADVSAKVQRTDQPRRG